MYRFTYPAQEQKLGKNPIDHATLASAGEVLDATTPTRACSS